MLLELHCHTAEYSSCSEISAVDLVFLVRDAGMDGLVITDHHHLWRDKELFDLRLQSRVPQSFLILSGQEVTTSDFGDVLVYGACCSFPQGISLFDLKREAADAALVWAHPYRGINRPSDPELFHANLDAIEIINSHHRPEANTLAISDWRRLGFSATSGTDIHGSDLSFFYPTTVEAAVTSVDDLAGAIKRGACRPTLPPKGFPRKSGS